MTRCAVSRGSKDVAHAKQQIWLTASAGFSAHLALQSVPVRVTIWVIVDRPFFDQAVNFIRSCGIKQWSVDLIRKPCSQIKPA